MNFEKQFKLEPLTQEDSNRDYSFLEINEMHNNEFTIPLHGRYYPYNYQFKDVGWGCAWRAIQSLLSSQVIFLSFEELYNKFSSKSDLIAILQEKKVYSRDIIEQLLVKQWAPAQIACHWAEPFIASIVSLSYRIPHHLFFLNGQVNGYAPQAVFQQIITFQLFCGYIKKQIVYGSVMIDDGQYALSIIGINLNRKDRIQLLFGDPHIRSNKKCRQVGLYKKSFSLTGKGISNDLSNNQREQCLYSVYDKLQFEEKCWMIYLVRHQN